MLPQVAMLRGARVLRWCIALVRRADALPAADARR
jgi:hypothetical protein